MWPSCSFASRQRLNTSARAQFICSPGCQARIVAVARSGCCTLSAPAPAWRAKTKTTLRARLCVIHTVSSAHTHTDHTRANSPTGEKAGCAIGCEGGKSTVKDLAGPTSPCLLPIFWADLTVPFARRRRRRGYEGPAYIAATGVRGDACEQDPGCRCGLRAPIAQSACAGACAPARGPPPSPGCAPASSPLRVPRCAGRAHARVVARKGACGARTRLRAASSAFPSRPSLRLNCVQGTARTW